MTGLLNCRAHAIVESLAADVDDLRISCDLFTNGGKVLDFGVEADGGIAAGLLLGRICMSGLGKLDLISGRIGDMSWPHVQVTTDRPLEACLLSQYAGWQISSGDYIAMGSGPMRAAAGVEDLFERLDYRETPPAVVGVLETSRLPDLQVFDYIAARTAVHPSQTVLCAASTSSPAGNLQVVARSIETAMHKLFGLGFDVRRVRSGHATAPLPPVAVDDLTGIGRTNDGILYGAQVTLWVVGDDASLAAIGPQVPASACAAYGKPFLQIFEDVGRDFYQIDPQLFSPAEIVLQNLDSGRVHRFGSTEPEILQRSFGL